MSEAAETGKTGRFRKNGATRKTNDMETAEHSGMKRTHRVAHRRDLTYQFPVYRWLSWLVIAGFAIGLGVMYLVAGMFGIPAPLGWAFLVVLFCAGIALLERPKQLLTFMMFYFMLMPSNRLFGLLGLPLPGFLDELFFIPFIAVIVMSCIERRELPKGRWFALWFIALGVLSWYVNRRPSPFGMVRVTLVMLKFFILWYFCRLTCPFESIEQFWRWGKFYIYYAAAQFLYNCLWQRAPWVTIHWDNSGGVFGPEGSGGAHTVGYISILALFLLAAWWMGPGRTSTRRRKAWMALMGVVIAYDLIFMTDTKHALLMMPLAFLPVLFHRAVPVRLRFGLLGGFGVVTLLGFLYISMFTGTTRFGKFVTTMLDTPKGDAYRAVTVDFPYLVPYPLLGAGPGMFFSQQAVDSGTPLARRYIIPYQAEAERSSLMHGGGTRTGGSLLAWPQCDVLTVMGEFGWLGMVLYFMFLVWVFFGLWEKARASRRDISRSIVYLVLGAGMLFLWMTMFFASTCTVPCLMFPWWMLIGRIWDMKEPQPEREGEPLLVEEEHYARALPEISGAP